MCGGAGGNRRHRPLHKDTASHCDGRGAAPAVRESKQRGGRVVAATGACTQPGMRGNRGASTAAPAALAAVDARDQDPTSAAAVGDVVPGAEMTIPRGPLTHGLPQLLAAAGSSPATGGRSSSSRSPHPPPQTDALSLGRSTGSHRRRSQRLGIGTRGAAAADEENTRTHNTPTPTSAGTRHLRQSEGGHAPPPPG